MAITESEFTDLLDDYLAARAAQTIKEITGLGDGDHVLESVLRTREALDEFFSEDPDAY
jgi:hypothetical protein